MNPEFIKPSLAIVDARVQVALARVAEEASEVIKEAMKALRFGVNNRYPADGPTNAEKIVAEFRDLEQALIDAGFVEPRGERHYQAERIDRLIAAIIDEGSHPQVHREILAEHRRQWPTLWDAIDRLVATRRGR